MANFHLKKKSKRLTCHKKYKILRKIREHHRKVRKEARQNPQSKRKPKAPVCPNSAPFKEKVIQEAEAQKEKLAEMKRRQKEERQKLMEQNRSIGTLLKEAQEKMEKFEEQQANMAADDDEKAGPSQISNATRGFRKDYTQVLEHADIILHVLDARDPLGTCFPQLEQTILNSPEPKKLVYILNKIDLIPKENLNSWLQYFRVRCPTIPFKASTQAQRRNLCQKKVKVAKVMSEDNASGFSSSCVGANLLMKLIGSYCPNNDPQPVTVGVVGFPNVGKSSVINSLKRSRGCAVGAVAGVTRSLQTVSLEKNIKIVDSPGVVMVPGATDAGAILRNALRVETIEDPIIPATYVVQRAGREQMALHYQVGAFRSPTELFVILAKKMGHLKKGGVPNMEEGARRLLRDWTSGKIKYFTMPPELPSQESATHTLSDDLQQQESLELSNLPPINPAKCFSLPQEVPNFQLVAPQQEEEMAVEEDTPAQVSSAAARKQQQEEERSVMPLNNTHRADFKKKKRKAKRSKKLGAKLSAQMEEAFKEF